MRERVRVRGEMLDIVAPLLPHPAFGHLLPGGEGYSGRSALLGKRYLGCRC